MSSVCRVSRGWLEAFTASVGLLALTWLFISVAACVPVFAGYAIFSGSPLWGCSV